MSDLPPAALGGGALSRSRRRELDRALAKVQASTSVELARVHGQEAVGIARVEAIGAVSTVGLVEVSNVSAVERAMFERTPHAAARLQLVADHAAAGIAGVVLSTARSTR